MFNLKRIRSLTTVILVIIAVFAFSSCKKGIEKNGEIVSLISNNQSDYVVIRSEGASKFEIDAAVKIRKELEEKTGVKLKIDTDWMKKGTEIPKKSKEILVGKTNRIDYSKIDKSINERKNNKKDFYIGFENERVIIYAVSNDGINNAIDYFIKNFVKDKNVKVTSNLKILNKFDYPEIKINGENLANYQIVVGKEANFKNKSIAQAISATIDEKVGYPLDIVTDDEKQEKLEIIVGETSRNENKLIKTKNSEYSAFVKDKKLIIGGNYRALEYGVSKIVEAILEGETIDDKFAVSGDYIDDANKLSKNEKSPIESMDLSEFQNFTSIGEAYYLIDDDSFSRWGLTSSWDYDERGAAKRGAYTGGVSVLTDISKTEPTSFTREFNKLYKGKATLETGFSVNEASGLNYFIMNDLGQKALHITLKDNKYLLVDKEQNETLLIESKIGNYVSLKVNIDMDKKSMKIMMNNKECGEFSFAEELEYISILKIATGVAEVLTITPNLTKLYCNYLVNERFISCGTDIPYDIKAQNGKEDKIFVVRNASNANYPDSSSAQMIKNDEEEVSLFKSFDKVSGKIAYETRFILTNRADDFKFSIGGNEKNAISIKTKGLSLFSGNDKLIRPYVSSNVWQTLRIELNTTTQKADIKLNGKYISEIYFENAVKSLDFLKIEMVGKNSGEMWIDDILVYQLQDFADYVSEPISVIEDDYIVGINICSLWREGTHFGWDVISPYEEIEPYLGYYDDGSPEVADWEIKWMTEHGIDFQLFCWYAGSPDSPMKTTHLSHALHEGYFNAKYSDKMKFALLWEASNGSHPASSDAFRENFVPYWVDYYFSDERYMEIDNKAVIAVFGAGQLIEDFGGVSETKRELDYVRSVCRELGYEGAIFMACNGSSDKNSLKAMTDAGFDAVYAYNWGKGGGSADGNIGPIKAQQNADVIHVIPTLSTGFNNVGWAGTRSENISVDGFTSVLSWFKDKALKKYEDGTWKSKLFMLSTWNEYGEGTYIMPSKLNGFGYVDALRSSLSHDEEHDDIVPTEAQKERMDRLYYQNRGIIKPLRHYTEEIPKNAILSWNFKNSASNFEDWENQFGIDDYKEKNGKIFGSSRGSDYAIKTSSENLAIPLTNITYIHLRMKTTKDGSSELFFITENNTEWNSDKMVSISVKAGEMNDYYYPVYSSSNWNGVLKGIRIDPLTAPGAFEIECIELLGDTNSMQLKINGEEVKLDFSPTLEPDGKILVSVNPYTGIFNYMTLTHKWHKAEKTLDIYNEEHKITFTVGSNKAIIDGTEFDLGMTVYQKDGLPTLPFDVVFKTFGFNVEIKGNVLNATK